MASAPKSKAPKAASNPRKTYTRKTATKGAAPKSASPSKATATKATTTQTKAKAPAKTPSGAKPPVAQVVTQTKPAVQGPEVKRNDLIDRVVARTDAKRRDVKPIVGAVLAELGAAIAGGENLNLEPFGKLKIKNEKDLAAAKVYVARLRRKKG